MIRQIFLTLILLIFAVQPLCSKEKHVSEIEKLTQQGKPLLKVGDKTIYEGQLLLLQELIPSFRYEFSTPDGRKKVVQEIIEQELFYQKAIKLGLPEKSDRLQKLLWLNERSLTGGEYLSQKMNEAARLQYEKDKEKYYTQRPVADIVFLYKNASGTTPEEKQADALKRAKELRRKLNAKNFSQLASENTEDPFGKADQGKIGPVSLIDQRVKALSWAPLVQAAFRLKEGQISEPIATAEGVHIIQPISQKEIQTFEQVLPFLRENIEASVRKQLFDQLSKEIKIQILEPKLLPPETQTKPSSSQ
ncbi:MAG: peptidylprolyl isomerase [Deltaproteobacteria bacterium]|nr:peptidylprolyl isomerase [Deltaproteobacteria bacterium]